MINKLNYNNVMSDIISSDIVGDGVDSRFHTNDNLDYGYLVTDMFSLYDVDAKIKLLNAITIEMCFGDYLQGVLIADNKLFLKLNRITVNDEFTFITPYEKLEAYQQFDFYNTLNEVLLDSGFKWHNQPDFDMFELINNLSYNCNQEYYDNFQDYELNDNDLQEIVNNNKWLIDYHSNNVGYHLGNWIFFDAITVGCMETINCNITIMEILRSWNIEYTYIEN